MLLLACLFVPTFSQINLDSLATELAKTHKRFKKSNGWSEYTIVYKNAEGLIEYEMSFDEADKPANAAWDLALTMHKYDEKGQVIESRWYDETGNLHFSDWPPIVRKSYTSFGAEEKIQYFGEDGMPISTMATIEIDFDNSGNQIEERHYNGKYKLEGDRCITRWEYSADKTVVTESMYGADGKLDETQAAYVVRRYETVNRERLKEKQHQNKDRELVEIKNQWDEGPGAASIKYIYGKRDKYMRVEEYGVQGRMTKDYWKRIPVQKAKLVTPIKTTR